MITGKGNGSRFAEPTPAGWPLAVVFSAVILLLWPVLFGDQTLFYRDLFQQYVGTARLLHSGGWPGGMLWDPFLNGGQPLLANPNRFILYPSRVLYLLLKPAAGLNLEITVHLLLGGAGSVVLARRLGVGGAGSAVAGLAYAVSGISVSITNHLGRLAAFHWMPWIILAVHAGLCERGKGSWRWRVAIPVLCAVQWLTGVAELAVMTALIAVGWMVVCRGAGVLKRRKLIGGVGLVILGAGLAAIQILPAAEMVQRSDRSAYAESGASLEWSAHPLRLAELVIPGFCGPIDVVDPPKHYWGVGLSDHGFPLILSLYLGCAVVLLAGVGWWRSPDNSPWASLRMLFGVLVGGAIILACGEYLPVVGGILTRVPGLSVLRYPVKALLMVGLPVALLAGRGCDAWREADNTVARRIGIFALATAGLTMVLCAMVSRGLLLPLLELAFPGRGEMAAVGLPRHLVHVAAVVGALGLIALVGGLVRKSVRLALLVGVVAADLCAAAVPVVPLAPVRLLNTEPPLVEDLRRELTVGRFFRDADPDAEIPFVEDRAWEYAEAWVRDLRKSTGETFLVPMVYHQDIAELGNRRIARLTRATNEVDWVGRRNLFYAAAVEAFLTTQALDTPAFELATVQQSAAGAPLFLYRVVEPPEMMSWVAGARLVSSAEEALGMLVTQDFDPTLEIVREMEAPLTRTKFTVPMSLQPGTEIYRQVISVPTIGFVVAAVPWHPDLVVEVNGLVIPAERVNYAFTGFAVERGRYDVRILFAPRAVFWGGWVSVLSAVILGGFALLLYRSKRPPGTSWAP